MFGNTSCSSPTIFCSPNWTRPNRAERRFPAAIAANKPLSFFSNGQNIPEDLEPARSGPLMADRLPEQRENRRRQFQQPKMATNALTNAEFYTPASTIETGERERLILDHLSHVRWVAMRIHEKIGGAVSLDDLVSAGVIGLINAVDSYDPKFNVKLKTYAEHRIRGSILDSIRGLDGIPAHKRKRLKEVEAAIATAEQRLQRVPGEEEIAAELRISLAAYQDMLTDLRAVSLGSLDEVADGFSESKLLRYVAQDEENVPARILERAELRETVDRRGE